MLRSEDHRESLLLQMLLYVPDAENPIGEQRRSPGDGFGWNLPSSRGTIRSTRQPENERMAMDERKKLSRRQFLAAAGGTLVSIGLPGLFVKVLDGENQAVAAELRPDGRPRLPPGQQLVSMLADMGGRPGKATISDWNLRVHGEVERLLTLDFKELLRLPQVELTCDVHCVTGWTLLDSRWSGVQL
jgi:hypothetical protein